MNSSSETFSVIFHTRKERTQDEKLPIYTRITINAKRIKLSVKQMIIAQDWNEKRGMAIPINDEYRKLNNYLEQLSSSFVATYREISLQKKVITIETFNKQY